MNAFHTLLINLDQSKDRLAASHSCFEKLQLDWERISAINGVELGSARIAKINPPPSITQWFRQLTPGEVGCFLSHVKCWNHVVANGIACALILEDDFAPELQCSVQLLESILQMAPGDWDVLKLSNTHQKIALGQPVRLHLGSGDVTNCTAYFISQAGAQKLSVARGTIHRPVDYEMRHFWERGLKIYHAAPNLFRQKSHEDAPSIIGDRSQYRKYAFLPKLKVYSQKHGYQIAFWAAKTWHHGLNPKMPSPGLQ
jgi:glycosyl transferase family 25